MVPASSPTPNEPPVDDTVAPHEPPVEYVEVVAEEEWTPDPARLRPNLPPPLNVWVRGALTGIALGLMVVFFIAWRLNPYNADGSAKDHGTHQGLGLPPCTFLAQTKKPCPACGMTTSFSLLVRGDVFNSLRANWVGTLLCAAGMLFVPWAAVVVVRGRSLFVRSLEMALIVFVCSLLVLMLLRWGIVLGLLWSAGEF